MNILFGLDAQDEPVLRLLRPFGHLIQGRQWYLRWCQYLPLHCDLIHIRWQYEVLHDVPDDELCGAMPMSHAGVGQTFGRASCNSVLSTLSLH